MENFKYFKQTFEQNKHNTFILTYITDKQTHTHIYIKYVPHFYYNKQYATSNAFQIF